MSGVELRCSSSLEFCALKKDASHVWIFNIISVSLMFALCFSAVLIADCQNSFLKYSSNCQLTKPRSSPNNVWRRTIL